MKNQIDTLAKFGFKATYIRKNADEDDNIINGHFDFVFGSPESIFGEDRWKNMILNYKERLKLIVIDEAHTVIQWGKGNKEEEAFRPLFSRIGELRSVHPDVPILAITATSGPSQCSVISESPDRFNFKISAQCIQGDVLQETFKWLLDDLKSRGTELPRHVIFSESILTVAKLYAVFRKYFEPGCQLFDMYHSKTVESVKKKIRQDMSTNGKIRVLICTNSAGMGVNFYGLHNTIHFGLPRDMDTFVQQLGRSGRDGKKAHELILYKHHKGHFKLVESELVHMVKGCSCRRSALCAAYACESKTVTPSHNCCDICEKICECGDEECPVSHPVFFQFKIN